MTLYRLRRTITQVIEIEAATADEANTTFYEKVWVDGVDPADIEEVTVVLTNEEISKAISVADLAGTS